MLFVTEDYDRFIPPDTNVKDIKDEVMDTSVYYQLVWHDPRFNWSANPKYSAINVIHSNNENIWIPKIAVANSISDLSVIGDKSQVIVIISEGTLVWVVGKIDKTHCDCDVTYYPFDTQTCELVLMVIGYTGEEVELVFRSPVISRNFFSENGERDFIGTNTIIDDRLVDSTPIRQLKFKLKFRRRPLFLFLNSLLPVTLLSLLTILIFKLPAESGEKIGFCLTVLLAFAVYVTTVSNHTPTTSISTSYLCCRRPIYLIVILAFGIVTVFVTIFVLYCHNTTSEKPVPGCLSKLASHVLIPLSCVEKGFCCTWKCCNRKRKTINKNTNEISQNIEMNYVKRETNNKNPDEFSQNLEMNTSMEMQISWKEFGQIVDSFSFNAALLINIVMGLV
ncbi:hypothetical protein KUTeg_022107, partial [Tegillarca granosa]